MWPNDQGDQFPNKKTGWRREKSVLQGENWSPRVIGGLHTETKPVVWWETSNCGSKTKETSSLTRKPAREEKYGLQGEKVVSYPCTAFQIMKIGSMPKMNQDRCKTRVRGLKRTIGCPEN
ncbi:hypothetical protein CsSME_00044750 [Camellia sinensis var. sinensis]